MNLIGLKEQTREDLIGYLNAAEEFLTPDGGVHTPASYREILNGRHLGLVFLEPSTRTRVSFEMAARRLGANTMLVTEEATSLKKGESSLDTCLNLAAMGFDALVVRHTDRQLPYVLAERLGIPIINAGNGSGEHPTQGLLDALTLRRHFRAGEDLAGLRVAIVGDIVHSRVARSNTYCLNTLGAHVTLAGPPTLVPTPADGWPARIVSSRPEALADADAVIVLRIQRERMHLPFVGEEGYVQDWGIDEAVMRDEMRPDAVIMHPGPVIRGIELTDAVIDHPRSLILRQVTHGVAIRQAILANLCRRASSE
ncbi:MAG: aspartate carbamoyltransferase catalytic subunit [Bradymonadaceae bacterium]